MKIKTALLLTTFFVLAQNVFAQGNPGKIEFALNVNQTEWKIDSQIIAKLTVKNLSAQKTEMRLPPIFELKSLEFKDPWGDVCDYGSGEMNYLTTNEANKIVEIKGKGKPQSFEIALESGESKTIEFDISRLGWMAHSSSVSSFRIWHWVIPSGDYRFSYSYIYDMKDKDKPRLIEIESNEIDIKIKSKK